MATQGLKLCVGIQTGRAQLNGVVPFPTLNLEALLGPLHDVFQLSLNLLVLGIGMRYERALGAVNRAVLNRNSHALMLNDI